MESSGPSQYVQASSPDEANKLLDALQARTTAYSATQVNFGPCVLYPSNLWLRTSSGKQDVGGKPYTKCSTKVTSIQQATDLRYKSFVWWRKAGSTHTGGNRNESTYTQKNVGYKCVSKEKTGWSGTTLGTITWRGKTYYARVYFNKTTLNCGG